MQRQAEGASSKDCLWVWTCLLLSAKPSIVFRLLTALSLLVPAEIL